MFRPLAVVFVALLLAADANAQGLLTRARWATDSRASPPRPAGPAPSSDRLVVESHWYNGLTDGDPRAILFGAGLAAAVASSPLWLPAALLEDNFYGAGLFPGHPYALPGTRYIVAGGVLPDTGDRELFDAQRPKPWSLRTTAEDGHDFGGLNRVGGRFALDTKWRLGVTSNWDHYTERLPGGATDETTLGDVNLTLRVAQADWLQMHAGVGARGLFDRYRTRAGFNALYGADLFLLDPLVVSTLIDMGNLNEAFVLRLRASAGVQLRHAEIFAGYDWLRIGPVDLHGPMLGLRLWF